MDGSRSSYLAVGYYRSGHFQWLRYRVTREFLYVLACVFCLHVSELWKVMCLVSGSSGILGDTTVLPLIIDPDK